MASIIDTPEGMAVAGLLQAAHGLALEVNTGLRHSRANWLVVIQNVGYEGPTRGTKKNKVQALKWLVTEVQKIWTNYTPSTSIQRALDSEAGS